MFEKAFAAALFPAFVWGAMLFYRFFRYRKDRLPEQEPQFVDHTQQVLLLLSFVAVISIALCIGYLFGLPYWR